MRCYNIEIEERNYVKKYGLRLLPELFEHLNPMSNAESIELEVSIAAALKKAGVPTYGGH